MSDLDTPRPDVATPTTRTPRRRGVVVAAVLVVAALVAGGALWHTHARPAAGASSHRRPSPSDVGTTAVSVTGTGQVFTVTSNQGCSGYCSTIWKQGGSGWTKLATFTAGHPFQERVVQYLAMAPDGQDGWAWGQSFWSTHDGGTTWSKIGSVPYRSLDGFDVQVGATEAWATSTVGRSELWHTPVGTDDWKQVPAPRVFLRPGRHGPARSWDVVDVLPDGRAGLTAGLESRHEGLHLGSGGRWTQEGVPCQHAPALFGGTLHPESTCGPAGRYLNWGGMSDPTYSEFQVALTPTKDSPTVGEPSKLYVRHDRAAIVTPSGRVIPSDLRLGSDDWVRDWSEDGDHVAILTEHHRVFESDDSGRHWVRQR